MQNIMDKSSVNIGWSKTLSQSIQNVKSNY